MAVIDNGCQIGKGTKIWRFLYWMTGYIILRKLQYRTKCYNFAPCYFR